MGLNSKAFLESSAAFLLTGQASRQFPQPVQSSVKICTLKRRFLSFLVLDLSVLNEAGAFVSFSGSICLIQP